MIFAASDPERAGARPGSTRSSGAGLGGTGCGGICWSWLPALGGCWAQAPRLSTAMATAIELFCMGIVRWRAVIYRLFG